MSQEVHGEAAGFHGARQALEERLVVLHDQERAVGVIVQFGDGVSRSGIPDHGQVIQSIWRGKTALPRPLHSRSAVSCRNTAVKMLSQPLVSSVALGQRLRGHAICTTAP